MNETVKKQLDHRTIREFKDERIPEETFKTLMEVVRRTPTSNGMQTCSIIRVKDNDKKASIAEICNQEYVKRTPELLIFIVDQFRNMMIAKEKGGKIENARDMDRFFQGFTDACLAAQNLVVAAESMGLGTVYFGSILNDPQKVIDIFHLPELTFPVVGLGVGYPNQEPQLKPRMDMSLRLFEDNYTVFDSYLKEIEEYDRQMTEYYDLRDANKRVDSFSDQIVAKLNNPAIKRQEILKVIKKQGFDLKI
ncbi:NADPH-dependent oxidoreductase [Soehngenia longivitae]|uniref:NADPH-dependent oxidoreductase n=1 Tax=Soehngenia longivitae TaxID=2562294 RepID=A0A4Z0D8B4_9FIRM|nr:NADPH-dependent oxidoreductase [Soehngenia longivitae]TFZ41126.1 NADPH-dependent oxidoreductase [Soehngenia longivitae]